MYCGVPGIPGESWVKMVALVVVRPVEVPYRTVNAPANC
jgi:hypothetical protein